MTTPKFEDLMSGANKRAWHLEMRDGYMRSSPSFAAWKRGEEYDRSERTAAWHSIIKGATDRGVEVRRARIISEPVSDYIQWEHSVTQSMNVDAGESVRWLPRRRASDLALPGNDFWIFDDLVQFGHFAGDGELSPQGHTLTEDPDVLALCVNAFESVWARGIDHADYVPAT